jgi:hypothetical protein
MEPFDEALDRHIWSLSDQRLQWDRTIADKRRNTPVQIEKQLKDHLGRQQEETPTLGEDHTIGRDLHTDDEGKVS